MNAIVASYQEQFAHRASLYSEEPKWLGQQREAAMARLRQSGFPGPRDEDWRYMPLKPLTGKAYDTDVTEDVDVTSLEPWLVPGLESHRLVFVDGLFSAALSSGALKEKGVSVQPLSGVLQSSPDSLPETVREAMAPRDGFQSLNRAFARDGYVIDITANHESEVVVECIYLSATEGKAGQVRNVLCLNQHAKACVIERHCSVGDIDVLVNAGSHIVLESGSNLDYYLVETMGRRVNMINDFEAVLDSDSNLKIMTVTLGGGVVRNNINVRLNGPGSHCDMLGVYAASGRQHIDNHTGVNHVAPHCSSRELYKGVLDQRSRGVFHGRIRVDQGATKTDATQANNNLLLSADAEVDTKPQLEIYTDDVKCAHGATVGAMDENSLFYLRSRGIDVDSARSLLTFAFVNEVLAEIPMDPLRDFLESDLARRLISDQ